MVFSQSEVTVEAEDLKVTKQKLTRKLNELREELARETSLRSSLEESHNSLLTRIKEMEVIVEKERDEVRTVSVPFKGSFTPRDFPSPQRKNATLTGKMGMQPILAITVSIKKIKGATCRHYVDGDVTVMLGVKKP